MVSKKDLQELGRRYKAQKNNIGHIYGYFINEEGNLVAEFDESLANMALDEQDKFLALLKKAFSGNIGQTILPIRFENEYMLSDARYKLLTDLRDCALSDKKLRDTLKDEIVCACCMSGNYLILMAAESYDIRRRGEDDDELSDSGEVHRYFVVSVCPVTDDKAKLIYSHMGKRFQDSGIRQLAGNPVLGLMFPAFDERSSDVGEIITMHGAKADYEGFIDGILGCERPKDAFEQKAAFVEALRSTVGEDLGYEHIAAATQAISNHVKLMQESGEEGDSVSVEELGMLMERELNVSSDDFVETMEDELDKVESIPTANLCDMKAMTVKAPGIQVKVSRELQNLVKVDADKSGNGKCLIIRLPDDVEIDGISITN